MPISFKPDWVLPWTCHFHIDFGVREMDTGTLKDATRAHPDPKTRGMALKILEGDTVDIDAVRENLGVDEVLERDSISRGASDFPDDLY